MREANASGDPNITPVWVQTFVLIWRLKDHSAREPEGFSTAFPFTSRYLDSIEILLEWVGAGHSCP